MATKSKKQPTKKVTGYKAFHPGMICANKFQYRIGETYTTDQTIALCDHGFHFCENPLDIFGYYDLVDAEGRMTEFALIEAAGDIKQDSTKSVTNKIHIKSKLDLPGFIKASFDFMWQQNTKDMPDTAEGHYTQNASSGHYTRNASSGHYTQNASSGDSTQNASSGHYTRNASSGHSTQNASSGDYTQNASSGDSTQNASSGHYTRNASSGHYTQNASSGHSTQNASSGDSTQNASSGHYTQNASSGHYTQNASSGHYTEHVDTGRHSITAAIGRGSKIKAIKGTWITLAEYEYDRSARVWKVCCVKSAQIDGKILKANIFYQLKNQEFVEVK